MGELPPAECQTELWVLRETDAGRAEAILQNALAPVTGPQWQCTKCKEECEPQFTQCWRCGAWREA
jgi:hypothetical protein